MEEIELKLGLERAEDLPRLLAELPEPRVVLTQRNHYLGDADGALARKRIMLRVRETTTAAGGGAPEQVEMTAKRRTSAKSGVFRAEEHESELPVDAWEAFARHGDPASLEGEALAWARDQCGGELRGLRPRGSMVNVRHVIDHEGLVLEVDRTTFPDGSVDAEVEVETTEVERARAVVDRAAAAAGVALFEQGRGKYARFMRRGGGALSG